MVLINHHFSETQDFPRQPRILPSTNNLRGKHPLSMPAYYQNPVNGSWFTKFECQLACALHEYIKARRTHRHQYHQGPTCEMLNDILQFSREHAWANRVRRTLIAPEAGLNAWCLVTNLRNDPGFREWYDEVYYSPAAWSRLAVRIFDSWVWHNGATVRR